MNKKISKKHLQFIADSGIIIWLQKKEEVQQNG